MPKYIIVLFILSLIVSTLSSLMVKDNPLLDRLSDKAKLITRYVLSGLTGVLLLSLLLSSFFTNIVGSSSEKVFLLVSVLVYVVVGIVLDLMHSAELNNPDKLLLKNDVYLSNYLELGFKAISGFLLALSITFLYKPGWFTIIYFVLFVVTFYVLNIIINNGRYHRNSVILLISGISLSLPLSFILSSVLTRTNDVVASLLLIGLLLDYFYYLFKNGKLYKEGLKNKMPEPYVLGLIMHMIGIALIAFSLGFMYI